MNSQGITRAVQYCMYALIGAGVMVILSDWAMLNLLDNFEVGAYGAAEMEILIEEQDGRDSMLAFIYLVPFGLSFFIVGRWIYVSARINHLAGARGLKYSPGWAVGWFFVPVLNLYRPYLAMREIYRASFGDEGWQEKRMYAEFGLWWGGYLVSGALSLRLTQMLGERTTIASLKEFTGLEIAANACIILSAFALLRIVRVVAENQQAGNLLEDRS